MGVKETTIEEASEAATVEKIASSTNQITDETAHRMPLLVEEGTLMAATATAVKFRKLL